MEDWHRRGTKAQHFTLGCSHCSSQISAGHVQVLEFVTNLPTPAWPCQVLPAEDLAGGTLPLHVSDGKCVRGQHCPACLSVSCGEGYLGASGLGISGCKRVVSSDGLERLPCCAWGTSGMENRPQGFIQTNSKGKQDLSPCLQNHPRQGTDWRAPK